MKKKVIFISQALWIGGIETALVNLLNRFDYDKYDVTCLIVQNSLEMAERITPKCRLIVADRDSTVSFDKPYKFSRLFGLIQKPQNASKLRLIIWRVLQFLLRALELRLYSHYIKKQLRNEHFDTAIIYTNRVSEIAVRALEADKFITFFHHGSFHREYHDIWGYKHSRSIVTVSDSIRSQFAQALPKYADKLTVIPNITDVEVIRRKSSEMSVEYPDGFNIVSCGRLDPVKGFDLAIEACKLLTDKGINDFHWHIIGGGPIETELKKAAADSGAGEHIVFYGMQQNPYPYMANADLFVQPSRFEGYSLSIMEALALSLPIVATKAAAGEQITDGINGVLCDTSAESIAVAVSRVISDDNFRNKLGENAARIDFEAQNNEILNRLYEVF